MLIAQRVSHALARTIALLVNAKSALHRTSSTRIAERALYVRLVNNRMRIEQRACRALETQWRLLAFVKGAQVAR